MHFLLALWLYILIHPVNRVQLQQKLHLNTWRLHMLFHIEKFLSDCEKVIESVDVAGVLVDCFGDHFCGTLHERVYFFKG